MKPRATLSLLSMLALLACAVPVWANQRLALVIGNADYLQGPLRNPVNDAVAISTKLEHLGFTVQPVYNLKRSDIGRTVSTFARRIAALNPAIPPPITRKPTRSIPPCYSFHPPQTHAIP